MIKKHKRESVTLRRDLGLLEATVAGVGIIIGAGIYVLIGRAAGHAGNAVWISFVISAVVAFLTGLSYAELSSIYDDDSGEYSYVQHTFGKRAGFIVGYLVMFAGVVGCATVSLGFAGYFNSMLNINNNIITALIAILIFTIINLFGIKKTMTLNTIFTSVSIVGLFMIIIMATPMLGSVDYMDYTSITGILKASSLIFFAYLGFDSVVQLSEETKNPKKNIPKALLLSILISTVIYILVAFASVSVIGWDVLSNSDSPLALVAETVLGSKAGLTLTVIALVSTSNTILLELIAVSRMIYGMSQNYKKIDFLSEVNKITNTPHRAVILTALLIGLFVLTGNIETVAETTNFAVFIIFGMINLSLIKSRYIKHKKEQFHEPFNIGKFPIFGLLGFLSVLFLMFNLEKQVMLIGLGIIIFGFILYELIKDKKK